MSPYFSYPNSSESMSVTIITVSDSFTSRCLADWTIGWNFLRIDAILSAARLGTVAMGPQKCWDIAKGGGIIHRNTIFSLVFESKWFALKMRSIGVAGITLLGYLHFSSAAILS